MININCKQREWQGGQCVDDSQCANKTTFSTCNKTNKICQCADGYLYLLEFNTCAPVRGLGENCTNSRQCIKKMPYSTCGTDKKCRCQQGYLELNNSCLPERQLNDTCNDSIQCSAATPHSTCGDRSGVCECVQGHLALSNACIKARRLGEQCENAIQCKAATNHSLCNKDNRCSCQHGNIPANNSCVSVRRLKEACDIPIQCSEATPNSTCNNNTRVCTCIEGHLEVPNNCLNGQVLFNEICKNKKSLFSSEACNQNEIERVCSSTINTLSKPLESDLSNETGKDDNLSLIIGVGVVCFLLGAGISGVVYFIITRNRRNTKLRSATSSDNTTEELSVQVSQHVNSRLVYSEDNSDEGHEVYNHLHQVPTDVTVQSDYDHAPQHMTTEDDYSHTNVHNKSQEQEPDYSGLS